jgi:nuclear pore complex protein Nup107
MHLLTRYPGHLHLNAARQLMKRISFAEVMKAAGVGDELEDAWDDSVEFWAQQLEQSSIQGVTAEEVMADARKFRELEALVKALDSLETMGSLMEISKEYDEPTICRRGADCADPNSRQSGDTDVRAFWAKAGDLIKIVKENMQPLLKDWLLAGIQGR